MTPSPSTSNKWAERELAFSDRLLRFFNRLAPTETQRLFLLTVVIGIACGLAAVAFHLAIQGAERLLIEQAMALPAPWWIPLTILLPTMGGLVAGLLLTFVVPDARGSGIPQVKVAYTIKGGRVPLRVAIGKFLIGVIQIGSGASLGREGPTVQICAGVTSTLGQLAALPRRSLRRLLPVGAAAGIAAAFNAPIAAVTFTIEEIIGDLNQTVLTGVIVAAAFAAVIEHSILGGHPVFDVAQVYSFQEPISIITYTLLGITAGVASLLFTESLLKVRQFFRDLRVVPLWARPAIGGAVTGLLAVVILLLFNVRGVTGGGYEALGQALNGQLAVQVMLALFAAKMVATVFSYSSGGAGGIFAPSLFFGGMLGGAFGFVDVALFGHEPTTTIGAFALVGMGAVFAGVLRAPVTSVLIIFEMTGSYGLILPLMIANMTAYALARRVRPVQIYESLLEQDGIELPHRRGVTGHLLEQLNVSDAMTANVIPLKSSQNVESALQFSAEKPFSSFPVVDEQQRFIGLVSQARLRRLKAENHGSALIGTIADRRVALYPDQRLIDAMMVMDQNETRQLAVVDGISQRVIGILAMSDVVRTHARTARQANQPDNANPLEGSEVEKTLGNKPIIFQLDAYTPDEHPDDAVAEPSVRYHEVVIQPQSPAAWCRVRDLHLPEGVLIVTMERAGDLFVPHANTIIKPEDKVTLFADAHDLEGALAILERKAG